MNKILKRFRKRNIQTNIHHFVLVILVVAVSMGLFIGLLINSMTLKNTIKTFYLNTNLPDVWVTSDKISQADEDFYAEYFDYEKRLFLEQKISIDSKNLDANIYVSNGKMSTPYIEKGASLNAVYVDKNDAEKYDLDIDYSKFVVSYNHGGNVFNLEFMINGFCSLSEDMVMGDRIRIFIDEDVFLSHLKGVLPEDEREGTEIEYNQALVCAADFADAKTKIENYYEGSSSSLLKIYGQNDVESISKMKAEVRQADFMSYSFPMLFVLVSVLVIISAISQLVQSQHYNIGLLKSMGVPTKTITMNYCGYGMFFCFIGSVFGLILAPLIVPNVTFDVYDSLYSIPREYVVMQNPILMNILVVFGMVLIGFFSSYFVCSKLIKKPPIECMRHEVKIKMKSRNKKNKLPNILKMSMRNIRVNKARTIMSIVSIVGCSLLFMIGYSINVFYNQNAHTIRISSMKMFSGIFEWFSLALMLLSIVVLIVQIFKERTKEMAMLRLHGMPYMKIWLTVLFEMMFVCAIGTLVSFALCQPALLLAFVIGGVKTTFIADFMCYFWTFLIIFLMSGITAAASIPRVYKLNITDTLKNPE